MWESINRAFYPDFADAMFAYGGYPEIWFWLRLGLRLLYILAEPGQGKHRLRGNVCERLKLQEF